MLCETAVLSHSDAYQRQNGAMIAEMRDADGNVIDSFKVDVNGLYD